MRFPVVGIGAAAGGFEAFVDIDRMKRASEEIRSMEEELLAVSDREQRRVGHDLHDGICQQLVGSGLLFKTVASHWPEEYLEHLFPSDYADQFVHYAISGDQHE